MKKLFIMVLILTIGTMNVSADWVRPETDLSNYGVLDSTNVWTGVQFFLNDIYIENAGIVNVNKSVVVWNLDGTVASNLSGGATSGDGLTYFNVAKLNLIGDFQIGTNNDQYNFITYLGGNNDYWLLTPDNGGGAGNKDLTWSLEGTSDDGALIIDNTAAGVANLILNDGSLGIGTSSPSDDLTILPSSVGVGLTIRESDDGNNAINLQGNAGNGNIVVRNGGTATTIIRGTGDTYFNGGSVGIGTTSPGAKLEVSTTNVADGSIPTGAVQGRFMTTDSAAVNKGGVIALGGSYTGTTQTVFGAIRGELTAADGQQNGELAFYTNLAGTGMSEKMRIDNNGNVGIGTTSPSKLLSLESGDPTDISLQRNGNLADNAPLADLLYTFGINGNPAGRIRFRASGTSEDASSMYISTSTGGSETAHFHIDENGQVGIGTSSPQSKLDVSNSQPEVRITDDRDGATVIGETTHHLNFYSDDTSSSYPKSAGGIRMEATNTYGSQYQMVFDVGDTGSTPEVMKLDVNGNLNITGNLYISGCIIYNGGTLGSCI